jgi:hypothetical protein
MLDKKLKGTILALATLLNGKKEENLILFFT